VTTGATATLRALEDELTSCYLRRRPLTAAQLGDPAWRQQLLPVVTSDAAADLARQVGDIRRRLALVPAAELATEDQLTLDMMTELSGYELGDLTAGTSRYVITPLPEAGLTSQLILLLPQASIRDDAGLGTFVRACEQIPQVLTDSLAELAAGRAAGYRPVGHLTARAVEQIEQYLSSPLADDPFVRAARAAPGPGAVTAARHLSALVDSAIRPAFRGYCDAIAADVLPSARGTGRPGLCWLPGGEQTYQAAVRQHTTLGLTPADIREQGLDLVRQLSREVEATAASLGWTASFPAVRDRLRGDRSLYFTSADQMLAAARAAMARALAIVPAWITDLPAATCEVREMSQLETRNGVLGRYESAPLDRSRPGYYTLSTADPASRPVYEAEALAHHESVPGHHIEIAKSQEARIGSRFRQLAEVTPYREGWALYTERLAAEIGLYSGPLDRLGMLSFQLWRAGRLVADTGLHALGWSRDEAIGFLWDHTILTRGNVENEVDRYIACPGQALGYMTGQLAFERLRSVLVRESASPQQNRAFHSAVLSRGPLTLGCLGRSVGVGLTPAPGTAITTGTEARP
jgi:uncharacterized protein (DUF885 family)